MGRLVFPLWGPLDRWWLPCYTRLNLGLVLTPIKEDAGADLTFEYPFPSSPDLNGWAPGSETALMPDHLPESSWPAPAPMYDLNEAVGSPFCGAERDYLRVIGPGLFVGCAYRGKPRLTSGGRLAANSGASSLIYDEEDCIYFAIARRTKKEDYIRRLDEEEDLTSDNEERASNPLGKQA